MFLNLKEIVKEEDFCIIEKELNLTSLKKGLTYELKKDIFTNKELKNKVSIETLSSLSKYFLEEEYILYKLR